MPLRFRMNAEPAAIALGAGGGRSGECYTFVKARSKAKTTTNGQAVRWPQMRIGFDRPIDRS
jgi:hypothetical protein